MNPIRIELAGEPRGKGRPRMTKGGVAYTPKETRNYEAALRYAAQQVMAGRTPMDGPVLLIVEAYMPIPQSTTKRDRARIAAGTLFPAKKPDPDNILKCMDALNGIAFGDDRQVVELRLSKRYDERPRLVIIVHPMVADQTQQEAA